MPPPSPVPVFRARALSRRYGRGDAEVRALDAIDLDVAAGEVVFVAGPSGSGKSTLLHLLGTLDRADSGTVEVEGRDIAALGERERALLRRERLGFVFQDFHLVPVLSALENVEYPLWIAGVGRRERRERAGALLAAVGLERRADHRPRELSGGERQRVAVARALVHRPAAILADEPTGNLDSATGRAVLAQLLALHREHGAALVVATHDAELLADAPRRVTLRDGRIAADERVGAPA